MLQVLSILTLGWMKSLYSVSGTVKLNTAAVHELGPRSLWTQVMLVGSRESGLNQL